MRMMMMMMGLECSESSAPTNSVRCTYSCQFAIVLCNIVTLTSTVTAGHFVVINYICIQGDEILTLMLFGWLTDYCL